MLSKATVGQASKGLRQPDTLYKHIRGTTVPYMAPVTLINCHVRAGTEGNCPLLGNNSKQRPGTNRQAKRREVLVAMLSLRSEKRLYSVFASHKSFTKLLPGDIIWPPCP
jgi:hypothetical protein